MILRILMLLLTLLLSIPILFLLLVILGLLLAGLAFSKSIGWLLLFSGIILVALGIISIVY